MNGELGLELTDTALCSGKLGPLGGRDAGLEAGIDARPGGARCRSSAR
jgi:hypothetical protein